MAGPLISNAHTVWQGTLTEGTGVVNLDSSGAAKLDLAWASRAEDHAGKTNPEELIGAAHSACFSMALSNMLTGNDTPPQELRTSAEVTFDISEGGITGIHLTVVGKVDGLTPSDFETLAETAKKECPVSKALSGVKITLAATLA